MKDYQDFMLNTLGLVVLGACTALSLSERLRTHTLYQWQDTKKETNDKEYEKVSS